MFTGCGFTALVSLCAQLVENGARVHHYVVQQYYFMIAFVLRKLNKDPILYLNDVVKRVEYCYDIMAARHPDDKLEDVSLELEPQSFNNVALHKL